MNNYICRFIELPKRVNAVTVVDENGDYNIYINSRLSQEEQKKSFRHECLHIKKNHFYMDKCVNMCEEEAEQNE